MFLLFESLFSTTYLTTYLVLSTYKESRRTKLLLQISNLKCEVKMRCKIKNMRDTKGNRRGVLTFSVQEMLKILTSILVLQLEDGFAKDEQGTSE